MYIGPRPHIVVKITGWPKDFAREILREKQRNFALQWFVAISNARNYKKKDLFLKKYVTWKFI